MDNELKEMLGLLAEKIDRRDDDIVEIKGKISGMETKISGMETKISGMETKITGMETEITNINRRLDQHDEKINDLVGITLNLENNITRKIESLFDGYKLAHEKQWDLERKVEELEKRLIMLEIKTA